MIEKEVRIARLKHLKITRIIAYPYKQLQRKCGYYKYRRSEDCRKLGQLKDTHKGERCFIIGNGPSLRPEDLEKLTHEFTFAANRIYEILDQTTWHPNVYTTYDTFFFNSEYQNIYRIESELKLINNEFSVDKKIKAQENMISIWVGSRSFKVNVQPFYAKKSAYIPVDVTQGFSDGNTVTFISIQMAIYMGFTEIYLLGVDFNYARVVDENGKINEIKGVTDYFDGKRYDMSCLYLGPTKHAYTVAKEYCDTHGIVIRNATRGGKLEVFERVDFDSLFENRHEQTCSEKRNK